MKTRQLRGFLEDFLAFQGVETERRGEDLMVVRPPKRLAAAIGAQERVLAFNLKGLAEDPRSELGTVGNPIFDRILELALETGRAGERFVKPGPSARKVPPPDSHFHFPSPTVRVGPPIRTYTPIYFALFRIEYSHEELPDELEIIAVDSVSHLALPQMPELVDYWEGLESEPAPDRKPQPAYPMPIEIVRMSLHLLEKRLRKRLTKIRRDAEEHMLHETENIKAYYTQLIEETRNAGRRWVLPAGGREERIRLLQLDWKRRVEEAQQYWRPHLDIRLSAVAAVQVPRLAFPVSDPAAARAGRKKGKAVESLVFWDEESRAFVDPACARCANLTQREMSPTEGGFLCSRCAPSRARRGGRVPAPVAGS